MNKEPFDVIPYLLCNSEIYKSFPNYIKKFYEPNFERFLTIDYDFHQIDTFIIYCLDNNIPFERLFYYNELIRNIIFQSDDISLKYPKILGEIINNSLNNRNLNYFYILSNSNVISLDYFYKLIDIFIIENQTDERNIYLNFLLINSNLKLLRKAYRKIILNPNHPIYNNNNNFRFSKNITLEFIELPEFLDFMNSKFEKNIIECFDYDIKKSKKIEVNKTYLYKESEWKIGFGGVDLDIDEFNEKPRSKKCFEIIK